MIAADSRTGALAGTILTDRDEAWVDTHDDLHWFYYGRSFTWTADRDGWRRLETVQTHANHRPLRLATGDMDVISVVHVDDKAGKVNFMASPDNPTQSYLYLVPLDGSGRATRVTPLDQPGTHAYRFSPGARWAFHTYSSFGRPPVTELVSMPDHRVIQTLEGNARLRAKLDGLEGDRGEFFRVDIGGGVVLDGWLFQAARFRPDKEISPACSGLRRARGTERGRSLGRRDLPLASHARPTRLPRGERR